MAIGINFTDFTTKVLVNKRATSSTKKTYEEFGDFTINVSSKEIWTQDIDSNSSTAVANGVAQQYTLFLMTEDITVASQRSYYAEDGGNRVKDWISDKYGSNYGVQIFDYNGNEIFSTDASGPFFNTQTGILTFEGSTASFTKPFKISGYRYIGAKGADGYFTSATINEFLQLSEISVPDIPSSGFGRLYIKADGKIYFKNDAGIEYDLTSGDGSVNQTSGFVGADGYLAFFTSNNEIAGDNDLFWNRETNRLGVGNTFPQYRIHVSGGIGVDGFLAIRESVPPQEVDGYGMIYVKDDTHLYFKNETGIEIDLTDQHIDAGSYTDIYFIGGDFDAGSWN